MRGDVVRRTDLSTKMTRLGGPAVGIFIVGFQFAGENFVYENAMWHLPPGETQWVPVTQPTPVESGEEAYLSGGAICGDAVIVFSANGRIWRATFPYVDDWELVEEGPIYVEFSRVASDGAVGGSKVRAVDYSLNHLWGSDDGGVTWSLREDSFPEYDFIAHNNFGTWVLLGSHTSLSGKDPYGNLAISSDGDTWTTVPMPNINDGKYMAAVGSNSDVIVLSQVYQSTEPDFNDGYLTTNGGSTWTPLDFGLNTGTSHSRGTVAAFTDTLGRVNLVGRTVVDGVAQHSIHTYLGSSGGWVRYDDLPPVIDNPFESRDRVISVCGVSRNGELTLANYADEALVMGQDRGSDPFFGRPWVQTRFDGETVEPGQALMFGMLRNGWVK